MAEPPRPHGERLMIFRDYLGICYVGAVMGTCAVLLYVMSPQDPESLLRTRALAFTLLAISPLMHALSCRSPILSIFTSRPLISVPLIGAICASACIHLVAVLVPSLQPIFHTFPISGDEWWMVLGMAALVLPAVEIGKLANRRRLAALGRLPGPPPSVRL